MFNFARFILSAGKDTADRTERDAVLEIQRIPVGTIFGDDAPADCECSGSRGPNATGRWRMRRNLPARGIDIPTFAPH